MTVENPIKNVSWDDITDNNGTFEHMSATGVDRIAPLPGKGSFTEGLIISLKELLDEYEGRPFTSFHLQQRLAKVRPVNPPWIWNRLMRDDRHIRLSPVRRNKLSIERPVPPKADASYLFLRFELEKSHLEDEEINHFTKSLARACQEGSISVKGVDWQ